MAEISDKEKKVYRVFERIAGHYDRANVRISLGLQGFWKRRLIREMARELPEGAAVLDVCCGTGDISLGLSRAGKKFRVVGIDFSPAMLKIAKQRRRKESAGRGKRPDVRFLRGNAMSLPFPDHAFHGAVISFGLRNTGDYERTLREMARAVKPGGRIYCLDSTVPDSRLVRPFYRLYFHRVMPFLGGGIKHREEYRWLSESTEEFLKREELMALFRKTGLEHVRGKRFMAGACILVNGRKAERLTGGFDQE